MNKILAFIKSNPVLSYYILVFAISWGGMLILIGPGGIPGTSEQVGRLMPLLLLIMFAGPSVSGLVMTGLMKGRAGYRDYLSRLLRWRVGAGWWVLALLAGPVLVSTVLLALSLISTDYLPGIVNTPNKLALIIFGVAWGIIGGGLLEETGWTGFAIPALRLRYNIFTTGLIVGILWGVWHFLIAFWGSKAMSGGSSQALFIAGFLAFYLGALPAYRILMVLTYDRTKSLCIAMFMHANLSSSCLILQPLTPGMPSLVWNLVLAVVLWIIVVTIAATNREKRSR